MKTKITKIESSNKNIFSGKLNRYIKQALSLIFIYVLVFVPLLNIHGATNKFSVNTSEQTNSPLGADSIFQDCAFGCGQVQADLENGAIDDVISFYNLPPTDRSRVIGYARSEIRSMLFARIITLIQKQSPTADEQAALNIFSGRIKSRRVLAAQKALEEYNIWTQNACVPYSPPAPFTYNPGGACYPGLGRFFAGPKAPSFEEFQQFGAAHAYADLFTPAAQDVAAKTARDTGIAVGAIGSIVVTSVLGATLGFFSTFGTISAVLPFAGTTFTTITSFASVATLPAASAPSGAIGATAVGGPVAIIIAAVVVAVVRFISVVNESQLPGKLQEAITNAQNQAISLSGLNASDAGNQELYGAFILATLPDFPGTGVPAPDPNDRQFVISQNGIGGTINRSSISYKDWNGVCHTARLNGAWFVDGINAVEKLTLTIEYLNWNSEKIIATRKNGQFIITRPDDLKKSVLAEGIDYLDCGAVQLNAKIKYDQLTLLAPDIIPIINPSLIITPDPGENFTFGTIAGAGEAPSSLNVTVNNGATATVNNMTVRNLAINNNYQITANILFRDAPTPSTADFTIKVRNGIGQEQSKVITIKKTTVIDTLKTTLPTNVNVGENYSAAIESSVALSGVSYSIAVTDGNIPLGLALQFSNLSYTLQGTPVSGGKYSFILSKIYANGERISKPYTVFVKSSVANLPTGATSWWRAENNAEDLTGRANGTIVGSVGFGEGKVTKAFKFNGTNGYIALPDETFSPSLDFTFETWFKTATRGVILGRQRSVTPYATPQFGATPAIYVDQNGKLRVQMFQNQNNQFTTSGNRVDDNAFHHVAVTYIRNTNTRTVYLDGANIGSVVGIQDASAQKYQFGTGFVSDGTVGGLNGWINFNGLIDEPTLYNRFLTSAEINEIFTAGGAGKISVDVLATPALTRDTATGSITITAGGGNPPLNYSIDGGNTFQNTNFFRNLSPGNYSVVVKDDSNRTVTRTATVVNPPPNLSLTTSQINPRCSGSQGGEIRIYATGSSNNLEYSVLGGANNQPSNVFTNLNAGTYTPWIHDLDSNTFFTGNQIVLTQPTAFTVSPTNFVNAALNVPYSRTFNVSGGTPPFTITAGGADFNNGFALPAGLTATADGGSITISGTPQEVGTFPVIFRINDANTCFESRNFPLTITSNATYGISGKVTNGGQGLANVTVSYAGASSSSTITDASGNYSFNNLAGSGNYTVTASLNGYTFAQPTLAFNNLSANFTDANFATAVTTFEGDIAPRPSGDGAVNVLDLVSLGRIITPPNSSSPPANGAEFQRADIAPRSSLGNGIVDTNDLNQLRNYVIATNPLTPAGGAITSAQNLNAATDEIGDKATFNENIETASVNQTSAVDTATISAGSDGVSGGVFIPITLNSNGNVSAVQFTITYNASKLSLTSVSNAAGLPANTVITTNFTTSGKINVVAYRPLDGSSVFPTGDVQLLQINFSVNQNAVGNAAIDFTDAPTARLAADPQANAITLNSTPGNVSITTVYKISGKITNGGQGLANVTLIRRLNFQDAITTTDVNGNYSFEDLMPDNNYTITPSLNGYSFAPVNRTYFLNNNFTNADFATTTTTYEGDIAGRPTGDGAVNVLDLVALGRIIATLDAFPNSGAEYQRTDIAPRTGLGDGAVNVQDLVQLGLYAGNLDPLTPAGGAAFTIQQPLIEPQENVADALDLYTGKLFDLSAVMPPGTATVSATSVIATSSTNVTVPIRLNSGGDTQAIQFTVNYDASKLSITSTDAIVNRFPNTTFIFNNNTPGKLGVVAYQPLDGVSVFTTGDIPLFDINFTVTSNSGGTTSVSFGNDPIMQMASSPQASAIAVMNSPGTITLLGPTAASVNISGRILTISGRGISRARIVLTMPNGEVRTALSNPFGYYRFNDLEVGQTYIIEVRHKQYAFSPQVLNLTESLENLNFTALAE